MVVNVKDIQTQKLQILEIKKNKILSYDRDRIVAQTPFIEITKFGLPNKSYIKQSDDSIDLSLPIEDNSELYKFLTEVDKLLKEQQLYNTDYNTIVRERDNQKYIRFKLKPDTTEIYMGKQRQDVDDVLDFYNYQI